MFFMMSITEGRKDFDFSKMVICEHCGQYGRYQVFMTYTVLALFFIPCFKWNKNYYVQMSCCNAVYELSPEVGKAVARGENPEILPGDMTLVSGGRAGFMAKRCGTCGYETTEDFEYCPKCGTRF